QIRQTVTRVTANGENVVTRVQSPGNKVQPGRRCRPEWVTRTGRGVGNRLQRLAPHRRSARSRPHARNRPPGKARPEPKRVTGADRRGRRSEEHTSELQSREKLVCRLLLEK